MLTGQVVIAQQAVMMAGAAWLDQDRWIADVASAWGRHPTPIGHLCLGRWRLDEQRRSVSYGDSAFEGSGQECRCKRCEWMRCRAGGGETIYMGTKGKAK